MTQLSFNIGNSQVVAPEGWTLLSQSNDKVVLCSSRDQQATISLIHFEADVSFDQFKTLCDIHVRSANKVVTDGFVEPESPFPDRGTFGMCFYGGDRSCGRVFFGYLSLAQRDLVTMFVEGVGVDPETHARDCQAVVKGLKWN
jgi:hypothetical protein